LLKRLFDLGAASITLVLLSPLMLLIAIAIVIDSGFPVFFVQWRAGKDGRKFLIFKYRTMRNKVIQDNYVITSEEDTRITRLGRLLRRLSLDELPQLFNVLKGEMSIVGPRPTLPYQVERYSAHQFRRLSVKPGITGWAQVNGRNLLSWREKIELDLWYIDHYSFLLDLKIIIKTLAVIFKRQGLYASSLDDQISATQKVVIAGAGGHGRVVADILKLTLKQGSILGFIDDNENARGGTVAGLPVLGGMSELLELSRTNPAIQVVIAIGDNAARRKKAEEIYRLGINFTKAIHPGAVIAEGVTVGEGTVVMAGAVINTETVIGKHVIINTSSSVDHDCVINDFAHISPGSHLGGGVLVGEGAQVGIGAAVLPYRRVGEGALVGAGAVVVKDIPPGVIAKGVPAVIKKNNCERFGR
jgi:perosamine synthetase